MAAWQNAWAQASPAIVALPVYLIIHVALWQVLPRDAKGVKYLVWTAVLAYFLTAFMWQRPLYFHAWTSIPLFAFEVVLYMHLYFGVDRSLSVRMLGELVQSDTGYLSIDELNERYPARDMVERRVEVLLSKGLLVKNGDECLCSPRGRFIVWCALVGKTLYGLRATG